MGKNNKSVKFWSNIHSANQLSYYEKKKDVLQLAL